LDKRPAIAPIISKTIDMQRVIWISGSTGNLGRAVVKRFAQSGSQVLGTLFPGEAPPTEAGGVIYTPLNLLDETAVQAQVRKDAAKHGGIDVAVLTAGGFAMGDLGSSSLEAVQAQISLNFQTAYNTSRAILEEMRKKGRGHIFLIGARPGLETRFGKGMAAYSFGKSLIFRLSEMINLESEGTGIVCSVVVPSIIDTPSNRASMPEADFGRWVTPEAIAETIHYYASPAAAHLREPILKVYGDS
jgi:NAD(P)-dependent dehydrogenase (short-subunit alcohol dehydrogenase family)